MGERVLLVSLDNLGDLVFASSLVKPLRERGYSVSLLCKEYSSAIAPLIPGLEKVFAADPFWDTAPGRAKGALLPFLKTLGRIRGEAFGSAIVVSRNWRPRLSARIGGIGKVASLTGRADESRPVLEDLATLLDSYGGRTGLVCELRASSVRRDGKLAVLHPFAGDRRRCLALAVWKEIAAGLRRDEFRIIWIASPAEKTELPKGDEVAADLAQAAAAMASAALFIGHDSGPLHVANALGTPSVGLYLPGQPRRTFPQGRGRFALIERPDPAGVSAQEILAAAKALLI